MCYLASQGNASTFFDVIWREKFLCNDSMLFKVYIHLSVLLGGQFVALTRKFSLLGTFLLP